MGVGLLNRGAITDKERLQLILTIDRASLSPNLLEMLKADIIQVISRYLVIDESSVRVSLNSLGNEIALMIGAPVIMARRDRISPLFKN
ncbi:MAG: cell division topological specificity factor MinE [Peptococcaceae bacterium]|nr:cell division topological specificity factor MinE [Peptococcaceae bacterium]